MMILKMAFKLKVNPGAEASLPEPAMGNMKPTTPGYAEKWEEKRAKQREELKDEPYCVRVEEVAWAFSNDPVLTGSFRNFWEYLIKFPLPADRIVSPRPSRDIKVMVCECWREEVDVPQSFPYRGVDILRLFGAGKDDMLASCATPLQTVGLLTEVLNGLGQRVLDLPE